MPRNHFLELKGEGGDIKHCLSEKPISKYQNTRINGFPRIYKRKQFHIVTHNYAMAYSAHAMCPSRRICTNNTMSLFHIAAVNVTGTKRASKWYNTAKLKSWQLNRKSWSIITCPRFDSFELEATRQGPQSASIIRPIDIAKCIR